MPGEAYRQGGVDSIYPVDEIAKKLLATAEKLEKHISDNGNLKISADR
jgi:chemotaxis response regulator CheB